MQEERTRWVLPYELKKQETAEDVFGNAIAEYFFRVFKLRSGCTFLLRIAGKASSGQALLVLHLMTLPIGDKHDSISSELKSLAVHELFEANRIFRLEIY